MEQLWSSRRWAGLALAGGLLFAVSCSSNNSGNNNANSGKATQTATGAASSVAASATKAGSPAAAPAGSPAAGGAATMSFMPPGGSAAWSQVASGCHGFPAPAGSEALKASDTGVTTTEIKLGSTFGLSGPGSSYAPIIKTVADCFNEVNAEGGIYGRKINFEILDDAYTAANTPAQTQKLVEQDKVFATFSNLGTPTQSSVYDYYNMQMVPQFYVGTGATKWSSDPKGHPWTIGFQPDYGSEAQAFAKYIQANLKGKKIGILHQNDDFGKDYVDGLKKILGDKGTSDNPIVDEEVYETSAADVTGQVTNLKGKGADLFYLIGIPKFAGLALKAASDQGWKPTVVMTDVSNDPSLNDLAGGKQNTEGVISAIYYHQYNDPDPSIQAVKDFLAKWDKDNLQFANFPIIGYMQAQLEVETLKRAGVNPTRKSLLQAAESFKDEQIPQLFKGITANTSSTDHRPLKCVQLSKFADGTAVIFGDVVCADK